MKDNKVEINSINQISGFKQKGCYECIHRRSVPGSTHSSCAKKHAYIEANIHGIKNGWVMHPFDFDPIWIEKCDSFISKEKLELTEKEVSIRIYAIITYLSSKINSMHNQEMYDKLIAVSKSILDTDNYFETTSVDEKINIYLELMKI